MRHAYLLEKLNFDKTAIQDELKIKGIELNTHSSDSLTESITNKQNDLVGVY